MEKSNKFIIFGLILGVSLIAASAIVARTFLDVRKLDNTVVVSGSAKKEVTADSARWTGNFSRTVTKEQMKEGYNQMKADEKIVNNFLIAQGFTAEQIEISPVFMSEIYNYRNNETVKEYNLTQNVSIKSDDVYKMKELAKNSDKLAEQGVLFFANSVEYYYSELPEVRVSLLPEAIKDAKARAEAIAASSGKKVDAIKSVSMGVVQVMTAGAIEISDYGLYDTSSIEKEVMVTVKANFNLK